MSERESDVRKIALIGDYLPRKCGIATYTSDLHHALALQYPDSEVVVMPVDDVQGGYDYPPEVRFQFAEQDIQSYHRAADFLNLSNVDVVCLQHEFGLFGGPAGSHILALLRDLRMPVVTTLHTVLREPDPDQRKVMKGLIERSARLHVMSEKGKSFLREVYNAPEEKIDLIPHGIPDMPFVDPNFFKDQFGVEGRNVLLTFGLLSPNKGIENALRAMPAILKEFPNTVYVVLGATHPNLVRDQGESYRLSLERMAKDLGVHRNVVFFNRFVELEELKTFLGAADIYITPYLNPAQITSGTLAYSFGCGKAVVSTPYWHAEELLADDRGVLVPFGDSAAIADAVIGLLRDDTRRHAMRKRAYLLGREMIWSHVAHGFMESFHRARRACLETVRRTPVIRTLDDKAQELPRIRLDHLLRITDSTGVLQHATYSIPNFSEGYCTDDNARALILTVMLEELGLDSPELSRSATAYAAFLNHAFVRETGRFRNFMSYDRRWLEESGSDDSLGRAVWALGSCVGRSKRRGLQFWGVQLFADALKAVGQSRFLRPWAFALVGIHEYMRRLDGDRLVHQIREELTERLLQIYLANASHDWPWFEDQATYSNATLCQALIVSGRSTNNAAAIDIGLTALRWLMKVQRSPSGCFRPIGCNGFLERGGTPAAFDQQPIEARATIAACIEAYRASGDRRWLAEARLTFEWFLGRNDLGLPICDVRSGGCCDGLHEDRVNQNQGAESTLAWLLSLAEMHLLENSLAAFETASDISAGALFEGAATQRSNLYTVRAASP